MTARLLILIFACSSAMSAFAQPSALDAEIQALRTYCKADVERLCPNVAPGGGRIKECLLSQKDSITVGCAKALQQLKEMKKMN